MCIVCGGERQVYCLWWEQAGLLIVLDRSRPVVCVRERDRSIDYVGQKQEYCLCLRDRSIDCIGQKQDYCLCWRETFLLTVSEAGRAIAHVSQH